MRKQAEAYLKKMMPTNKNASFRDGQWESIEALLNNKRVLVIQRTGWGKSMVYFLVTKLLRSQGCGPTIIISPLLALMRNQLAAAEKINLRAVTINSTNTEDWDAIINDLDEDKVDMLLISPERIGNKSFVDGVLNNIAKNIGLFVIDEAHCISDWGHDFRPDYRRISRILALLPLNMRVLATTATANNRVVEDIKEQIGKNILLQRGSLVRKSLKLQNINMPSVTVRMAWLAKNIPDLPGSGIVYTLTQRDAERVAEWLRKKNIKAEAYHSSVSDDSSETFEGNTAKSKKEQLEEKLLNNQIKVLVATVALGMGFDKPDLGFVVHFQRPQSVVHYYQQVGRAGRAIDDSYGILLCGEEDDLIADFFIKSAFPIQSHIIDVISTLIKSEDGYSIKELQNHLNLKDGQIRKTLNFLNIESPSPIIKDGAKYKATPIASAYEIDQNHIDEITKIRKGEQEQMRNYMETEGCLMAFLQNALDDPSPSNCGQCKNCKGGSLLDESCDINLVIEAQEFLCTSYRKIIPRKQWPAKNIFTQYSFSKFKLKDENIMSKEGRSLSLWRDGGWGQLVYDGKYVTQRFDDKLIDGCIKMLSQWDLDPNPEWITCIPSKKHPELVSDFAQRLAEAIDIPFIPCIEKTQDNGAQKMMENSYYQVKNLDGVFSINRDILRKGPCLLIDDIVDSGWTFTIAAALLRQAGCSDVYPMALAANSTEIG